MANNPLPQRSVNKSLIHHHLNRRPVPMVIFSRTTSPLISINQNVRIFRWTLWSSACCMRILERSLIATGIWGFFFVFFSFWDDCIGESASRASWICFLKFFLKRIGSHGIYIYIYINHHFFTTTIWEKMFCWKILQDSFSSKSPRRCWRSYGADSPDA